MNNSAMKTILVPIDYSPNSKNALVYALEIARMTGAELILFHAFYPILTPPTSLNSTDVVLALEEGKAKSLEDFALALRFELANVSGEFEAFENVKMQAVARMGGSYEMILEAIKEYDADLVVMGMQGGGPLSQALLGSTTISVMQECKVPLLAVPESIPFRRFRNVLFAVNLRKMPPTADLRPLHGFVKAFGAELQVLHLYRNNLQHASFDPKAAQEQLASKLAGLELRFHFGIREEVAEGIQQYIKEHNSDLLVMIPQRHNILARMLNKSITGKITAHPQVPLLALPASTLANLEAAEDNQAAMPY